MCKITYNVFETALKDFGWKGKEGRLLLSYLVCSSKHNIINGKSRSKGHLFLDMPELGQLR